MSQSSLQRSPTTSSTCLSHTQSESDINTALQESDCSFINKKRKNKRLRLDGPHSPGDQEQLDLKHEIMAMLNNWKAEFDSKLTDMFTKQNNLISKLSADISELKLQNSNMQKSLEDTDKSMKFINKQYEDIKAGVVKLDSEHLTQRKCIENLERRLLDLNLKSRSSCIEIRNIPMGERETSADLSNIVCKIGRTIGSATTASDLRDIYRIPGKPDSIRPIVAEFQSVQLKQETVAAVRAFNKSSTSTENKLNTEVIGISGKRQPVYVSDHLPASSKKLFHLSKEFAKQNSFQFCWSSNGNIFLRKVQGEKQLLISSEQSLLDLRRSL